MKKLIDENDNIKGLKDSVTLPGHTNELCRVVEDESFKIYSGFDDQYLYNISTGGKGCIAALSNIVPDIWSDLVKASNDNEFNKVLTYSNFIHRLMPLYNLDSNFSLLFKKLMRYRGLEIKDTSIFPFNQIDDNKVNKAIKILDEVLDDYKNLKL